MQYSLLSRFEGCLWGMVLGEQFDRAVQASRQTKSLKGLHPWQPEGQVTSDLSWSRMAIQVLQAMTRSQSSNSSLIATFGVERLSTTDLATGATIATLPISLYYHDDLSRQRHYLWRWLDAIPGDPVHRDWVTIFAYAIAQAVKGQLHSQLFASQLLAYYQVVMTDGASPARSVLEQLQQIEACQTDAATATTIWATLDSGQDVAVAIALICFLQTPDDLRLALMRSARLSQLFPNLSQGQLSGSLVGALVGAYTSVAGIPPTWKLRHSSLSPEEAANQPIGFWAELLFASWSGLYDPIAIAAPLAVAAPWVNQGQ